MLKFLKWLFGLFSPYVNSFERKVDKFFSNMKSTDSSFDIKKKLLLLMKEDLIVVNVWLEKKFKGYIYLSKSVRRKMYEDVRKIIKSFKEFRLQNPVSKESVVKELEGKSISYSTGDLEKLQYLSEIMQFLMPGRYYHYINTASFGKLLRDPSVNKLEGDCNQIVTLYIYLYSLKYSIEDLNIKLLPEHVCLHFKNIDIEATNATFQKYKENLEVLPVSEIISTNLLDLTDFREDVQVISERTMLKSAQLAYSISSLKSLVAKNLNIAYKNLGIYALKVNDFKTAIFYISKTDDSKLLNSVYKNASIYYLQSNNFERALYYASKSHDSEMTKTIHHNEGVYYFNKNNIDKALEVFTANGDEKMKKACYAKKYNELIKKVAYVKTLDDAKKHKSEYREMLNLAQKMGDNTLASSVRETLSKI